MWNVVALACFDLVACHLKPLLTSSQPIVTIVILQFHQYDSQLNPYLLVLSLHLSIIFCTNLFFFGLEIY